MGFGEYFLKNCKWYYQKFKSRNLNFKKEVFSILILNQIGLLDLLLT
jgi:hypothetical protein